jgi:hypothetical protein
MKITLWGHRAAAFSIDDVYSRDEAKPIVVLFVGGIMKSYQGTILRSSMLFIVVLLGYATSKIAVCLVCCLLLLCWWVSVDTAYPGFDDYLT